MRLSLDGRNDTYAGRDPYRVYELADADVVLVQKEPSEAHVLSPTGGRRRHSHTRVQLRDGDSVLFDTGEDYPIGKRAEAFRTR